MVNNGSFFSTSVVANGTVLFSNASVSYSGPASPLGLPSTDGTTYGFQSTSYPTKADMDADFPHGAYVFSLQPIDPTASPSMTSLTVGAEHYAPSGAPFLTGASYTALQGMDATKSINLGFSAFTTDASASESFVFLTVYDYSSNNWAFISPALSATTTDMTLPANLLTPGHSYAYELDYSSRIQVATANTDFAGQIGYEMRTQGFFVTAAVPEPETYAMLLAGLGLIAAIGRRRRQH